MPKKLAEMARSVRTMAHVNALLTEARKAGLEFRVPVGNRENNTGTIRVASDPGLALVERVTNGIDALLELGRLQHPDQPVTSPREAAQAWFSVPKGGLGDMTLEQQRPLGAKLHVELAESDEKKRPTVIITDQGIGQAPDRFPKTLLSLNESNKRAALHLMGAYGQGGAATFGFSRATVIVSRRHPDHRGQDPDEIGWTLVMEQFDAKTEKLPSYKYLADSQGRIPRVAASALPDILHGTTVVHVAYDLQGLVGPFTALRGGLWQFLHAALFDPVLPFLVSGSRAADTKKKTKKPYGSRVVIGNAARLHAREEVEGDEEDEEAIARKNRLRGKIELRHHDSHRLDLGPQYGSVNLNYWALGRPEGADSDDETAASYVTADSAVVMTLFGQRQDAEARTWIKDEARLPFLYKHLVVQVDADNLTGPAKIELFSSTRERATNSELKRRIYDELASALREDDVLKDLNRQEKEKLLSKSTSATNKKIQERLAKFVQTKLKEAQKAGTAKAADDTDGSGKGDGYAKGTRKEPPKPEPPEPDPNDDHNRNPDPNKKRAKRNTDDADLPKVPTHLRFKKRLLRIYQAGRAYVWVEIDAKNGYLPEHDDALTITLDDPLVRATTRSKLLGGTARWGFEADGAAILNKRVKLRAELMTPNGLLHDEIEVEILESPEVPDYQAGGAEEPTGPNIQWRPKDNWPKSWDGRTVGSVDVDDETTIIWVNQDLNALLKATSGVGLTEAVIVTRRDRFLFPVACALWLQNDARVKAGAAAPSDEWRKREMERVAEAVLLAIDPDSELAKEDAAVATGQDAD